MKNILLNSFLLISSFGAFAQLSVKPNGPPAAPTSPAYIYVKDQVLFVKQDIALTINDADENTSFSASIYLRDGAQLIQGDGANQLNSGNGTLSVYQTTPTFLPTLTGDDSWDYTFWCPPVNYQPGLMGTSGNKNFGALRIFQAFTDTRSTAALVIASTDNNGIENPMAINRRWLYTQPYTGYNRINASYGVTPGLGFTMKGLGTTNHAQTYDFRGRPNNGTMTVPVSDVNSTLSGNPYPSALDLNRMFYATGNDPLITKFEYWDENRNINTHLYRDNEGGFGSWVPGASNPTGNNPGVYVVPVFLSYNDDGSPVPMSNNGNGRIYERRFAPIGQGFMIVASAVGDVTISNDMRRYIKEGNNSDFRRGESDAATNLSDVVNNDTDDENDTDTDTNDETEDTYVPDPMIRIYTSFNDTFTRDMVLVFNDQTSDGFDRGYDAPHPMDALSEIYFPVEYNGAITPFVIEGTNFNKNKEYPVNFTIANQSKISLRVVEEVNMPVRSMFLWDNVNDTYYRINNGRVADFSLTPGNYNNRFYIVFNPERRIEAKGGYNEAQEKVLANVDFFQNNKVGQLEVSNPEGFNIKNAGIYDMSGKLVYSQENLGNSTNFSFPTAILSDGVYLVKMLTTDNIALDYKTIVQNK